MKWEPVKNLADELEKAGYIVKYRNGMNCITPLIVTRKESVKSASEDNPDKEKVQEYGK